MALQLIFCVETNKKADTDSSYISEAIRHYYIINNQIKISKVFMGTKSRYNSTSIQKEVSQKRKLFTSGNSIVIYCIDTDKYECDSNQKRELDDILQFCKSNAYEMIWFCHDVEEVFVGKKVPNSSKVKEVASFKNKKKISEIDIHRLSSNIMKANTSNILTILDKYLVRK